MRITTFNPMILTKKPEETIALFEALGFERHHHIYIHTHIHIYQYIHT